MNSRICIEDEEFSSMENLSRGTRISRGIERKYKRILNEYEFDVPLIDDFSFFVEEGWILGKGPIVKPGKEACVYRCPGNPMRVDGDLAIKIYKDQERRSFKAMSSYLEGRFAEAGINRRDTMHILSTPGALQAFWVEAEYSRLALLYEAGISVPRPYARNGTAIAMEFIGDGNGNAAPRLIDCTIAADEARAMLDTLLVSIRKMLSFDTVHGDLSPYNILVRFQKPVIIDFPQAVSARFNSSAKAMLERDIHAVLRFLGNGGDAAETSGRLAKKWWAESVERGCLFR